MRKRKREEEVKEGELDPKEGEKRQGRGRELGTNGVV